MTSLEEFKNKLAEIMTIKKELAPGTGGAGIALFQEDNTEEGSDPDMDALNQLDQETPEEDTTDPNQENSDQNDSNTEDNQDQDQEDGSKSDEVDQQEDQNPPPQQPQQSDNQKIQEMFKDTGNPDLDYSLTNDNNVRMYKFKFTYAGINVDDLMKSDEEKSGGLSKKELESRLSPEQLHYYNDKWQKLRDKYPQIAQREKNILIYNANIMLMINDKSGKEIPLPENRKTEAFKKINTMMDKKFGETWQDMPEALNFLKNIKINFSNEKPVRNNLLSVNVLQEKDGITGSSLIPFNKIYIEVPTSVQNFLRMNQEMGIYNDSSIFQSLSSDFKEGGKSVGSMDAIIKGSAKKEENTDKSEEDSSDGGDGGGGMGDLGGDMGGGDLGGDIGGDTGDTGDENSGDTGDENSGDTGDENTETDAESVL
jgi:hypothetical protein